MTQVLELDDPGRYVQVSYGWYAPNPPPPDSSPAARRAAAGGGAAASAALAAGAAMLPKSMASCGFVSALRDD